MENTVDHHAVAAMVGLAIAASFIPSQVSHSRLVGIGGIANATMSLAVWGCVSCFLRLVINQPRRVIDAMTGSRWTFSAQKRRTCSIFNGSKVVVAACTRTAWLGPLNLAFSPKPWRQHLEEKEFRAVLTRRSTCSSRSTWMTMSPFGRICRSKLQYLGQLSTVGLS